MVVPMTKEIREFFHLSSLIIKSSIESSKWKKFKQVVLQVSLKYGDVAHSFNLSPTSIPPSTVLRRLDGFLALANVKFLFPDA